MRSVAFVLLGSLVACDSDGGTTGSDAPPLSDTTPDAASLVGTVTGVIDVACPANTPASLTCKQITVGGCPGIESESLTATLGIAPAIGTTRGTIVHFSGGGGTTFQLGGAMQYTTAGFRQVFVAWASDWEQTTAGIRAAGCRPSTVLRWIFDEPTLHAGSRAFGFCGEGFSGGSGQLGYALAHYGLGDYLDYVNELSGPPFARIDLGCDGNAPATAQVCGATVTMRLPGVRLDAWENNQPPSTCGATGIAATELERWKRDSIAFGGSYAYAKTRVEFFDCTNQATAVTAMAQLYHDEITSEKAFHCYSDADGCQGEGLGTGAMEAVQAMIAGCVPRH
jgi:hypothetical protein